MRPRSRWSTVTAVITQQPTSLPLASVTAIAVSPTPSTGIVRPGSPGGDGSPSRTGARVTAGARPDQAAMSARVSRPVLGLSGIVVAPGTVVVDPDITPLTAPRPASEPPPPPQAPAASRTASATHAAGRRPRTGPPRIHRTGRILSPGTAPGGGRAGGQRSEGPAAPYRARLSATSAERWYDSSPAGNRTARTSAA